MGKLTDEEMREIKRRAFAHQPAPPAECEMGPLDGEPLTADWGWAVVVLRRGDAFTTRRIRFGYQLPKKYRDDPAVLGWYTRCRAGITDSGREFYYWRPVDPRSLREQHAAAYQPRDDGMFADLDPLWTPPDDDDPADEWKRGA